MLAFLADEHIPPTLVVGLRARQPALDIVTVQEAGLRGTLDPDLIAWAAIQNRILVTFDRNSLPAAAYSRIGRGEPMVGVVVVDSQMSISRAIDQLLIIAECCYDDELKNQVWYVPLP